MRACGILLPVFSLRGEEEIGTIGAEARRWIDFLEKSGVKYWQMLPIGPTGYGNSPYQPFSSFAGNPLLISLEALAEQGLLTRRECSLSRISGDKIDYGAVKEAKTAALWAAFSRFEPTDEYDAFCGKQEWLDDYALFMAAKDANDQSSWETWEGDLRLHRSCALNEYKLQWDENVRFWKFVQYEFYRQWKALRQYAKAHHVAFIGDLPIYVSLDSADVWSMPEQFQLDAEHRAVAVAGCPPDYFSEDGQLWGNPLYAWDVMKADGYRWWRKRLAHAADLFDVVRIDHFRGFASYWSIPSGSETARNGCWKEGPGAEFFRAVSPDMTGCDVIAEDLGVITDDVRRLLEQTGFPGMSVLQFAFMKGKISEYLPFRQKVNSVCYTGTHDNDTLLGWLNTLDRETLDYVYRYTHTSDPDDCSDALIDMAWSTRAELCVVPLQDLLHLGSEARINTPSVCLGNWEWRMPEDALTASLSQEIAERNETFFR